MGWEAIEREAMDGGSLDLWIERNAFDVKKGMELNDDGTNDATLLMRMYHMI